MKNPLLVVLGAALVLTACSSEDSTGLATNQITADYSVSVDTFGKGDFFASVIYKKSDDAFTKVHLEGGDTVTASTDKDPLLTLDYDSNLLIYSVQMDGGADRTTLSFNLNRAQGKSTSTVALPGALALSAPTPMAIVPYAGGTGNVDFTWSNSIPKAEITVAGFPSCSDSAVQLTTTTATGTDTGTISIPMSTLLVGAPAAGGQCITVQVGRKITGTPDAALSSDSVITAERLDYVKIVIMP